MAPGDRLIFADNRSIGADLAWAWIEGQQWPGWELVVLEAEPPPYGMPVPAEQSRPHPDPDPTRTPRSDLGFSTTTHLRATADPRVALVEVDASLVVVGPASQGRPPLHLGSTTEWLLHSPPTPVVVARLGGPVRQVLACVDGSPHSGAALRSLAAMPWLGHVEVSLLAVDDGRTRVDAALDEATAIVGDAPAQVRHLRRSGDPRVSILSEAGVLGADLIVAGTRGLTVLRRLVVGSTASVVTRAANCSVLVAHAP